MSNEELVEQYVQWLLLEKGRSAATIEAYRRDIRQLIAWLQLEDLTLETVTEDQLERYFAGLRQGQRASSSVARAISSVRGWLGFLLDEGHLPSDVSARLRAGNRGRRLPKPLDEAEVFALLDSVPAATPVDLRDRALLELLYGTGARVSEATGIALEHLDFDEELILVTGKGSKQRLVPMGATLRRALADYLDVRGRPSIPNARHSSRLFVNVRGAPLSRQGVDLIIGKRALGAGLERSRISAHVFRHSCATHMLAHGADIRVVQELLGHASIATTQVYTAVSVASLQREYQNAHPRAHE